MNRKPFSLRKPLIAATVLALAASGLVFADDSSMSMWTGDSYAYFNNLDYSAGKFNTARAPKTDQQDGVAKSPGKKPDPAGKAVLLAKRHARGIVTSPFHDDTAG